MLTVIPCPGSPGNPPVYVIDTDNFEELVTWLRTYDLPSEVILDFRGTVYRFRSLAERLRWAEGFELGRGLDIPLSKDDNND